MIGYACVGLVIWAFVFVFSLCVLFLPFFFHLVADLVVRARAVLVL